MNTHYNVDIQQLDMVTNTNRVYLSAVMAEAIRKFEKVPCFGTVQDANSNKPLSSKIQLNTVALKVTNLRIVDKHLIGDIEILSSTQGNILAKAIRDKCQVAYRLRSLVTYNPGFSDPQIVSMCDIVAIDALVHFK